MKHKIKNFFIGGENFREEFKKEVRFLIIVFLGFTVAFSWRQTIFDSIASLVKLLVDVHGEVALSVLTSTFTSVIALILIYITSQLLKEKPDNP